MKQERTHTKRATPWWAAIGAPLVGVPLLVALLSLAAPEGSAETAEQDMGQAAEESEVMTVGVEMDAPDVRIEAFFHSC